MVLLLVLFLYFCFSGIPVFICFGQAHFYFYWKNVCIFLSVKDFTTDVPSCDMFYLAVNEYYEYENFQIRFVVDWWDTFP